MASEEWKIPEFVEGKEKDKSMGMNRESFSFLTHPNTVRHSIPAERTGLKNMFIMTSELFKTAI